MSSKLEKLHKESKAKKSEQKLIEIFSQNGISFIKLDEEQENVKSEYLENKQGKCPDFYCEINGEKLFIEVKTITNTTNDARERKIKKGVQEAFEPRIEFIGPMTSLLKDASEKLKNIRTDYKSIPRILFITGIFGEQKHFICSVCGGIYETGGFNGEEIDYWEWRKQEKGLFDSTGSNVSAIVYWNDSTEGLECLANYNATINFKEEYFYNFFGRYGEKTLNAFKA